MLVLIPFTGLCVALACRYDSWAWAGLSVLGVAGVFWTWIRKTRET